MSGFHEDKYIPEPNSGCWIWTGCARADGYGSVKVGPRNVSAHRAFASHYIGKIPKGLLVLHSCDNPSCVNPDHLRFGTPRDNMRDMVKRGRHRVVSRENRITKEEKMEVGRLLSLGLSGREIEAVLGVSRRTVVRIRAQLSKGVPLEEIAGKTPFNRVKLSDSDVLQIRELKGQEPTAVTAKRFGVGQTMIWNVQAGKRRLHSEIWCDASA